MGIGFDSIEEFSSRSTRARRAVWVGGVGLVYFLAQSLAFLFPDTHKVLMALWPPAGVGLAAFLLSPRRIWPHIVVLLFIGGNLVNILAGRPLLASFGFMSANMLESLGSAWLILRVCGERPTFHRVRHIVALLVAAVFVNALTSFIGAGTAHVVSTAPFWAFWKTWWISDGLGILLATPAIVVWLSPSKCPDQARWPWVAEACVFLAIWCTLAWSIFNPGILPVSTLPYLLVALLVWPAMRLGLRGTTIALILLASIVVTSASVRQGPPLLGGADTTQRLLLAQVFVWVVTMAGLFLAATFAQARSAGLSAREEQLRIRALGDNIPDGMVYQVVRELDGSMCFVYVSAGVERLHGVSVETVQRRSQAFYDLILDGDRPLVEKAQESSAKTMATFDLEVRFRRPDGGVRWTRLASSPRRLPDGRILWDGIQTDISARKQAEAEAKAQTALLESQLSATIEGILIVDKEGNKILQNQRCIELWKIPTGIVANHDDRQQVEFVKNRTKDPDAFVRQVIYLYGHPYETSHDEVEFRDGMVLDRYSAPVLGNDGSYLGRIWTFRDITERKRVENALRESEEKFAKVFHNAPVLIAITDLDTGQYVDVNDESLRVSGYKRDEVIGHTAAELGWLLPEARQTLVNELEAHGRIMGLEMSFRTKYGQHLHGFVNGERIVIGQRPCLLTVTVDMTHRKQAEAKLAGSEERFRKLFEECPIGIAIFGEEREIALTNRSYCQLLRLSEDEVIKRGVAGILHPDSRESFLDLDKKLRDGEIPLFHMEQRCVRGDGQDLWADTHVIAVRDQAGQVLHTIGWVQDISERKQAEADKAKLQEQLSHAQKMESVGRLAGGVAHDFNNMLGVILGHVELALEDVEPSQPLHILLSEIHKAASRSADLTRQLLAFARKQTMAPKVIGLDEHVAGLLKMLKRLVGENVKLAWLPGAGLWSVKIDPSQIDQILANLCVNARDAIADVGKITIEAENATVGEEVCSSHPDAVPGEYVRLAVSDDGCGMEPQTLERIFEPYFTTKGIGRGTGLGLATVYGAVKQSNGFIQVHSEPKQGTTFFIYLPRYSGGGEPVQPENTPNPSQNKRTTILVVEDESALLQITTLMLEKLGYTVVAASTPGEAIRLAELHAGKIGLLLTDVIMPEMNGRDLVRQLTKMTPRLKYLFMSGYSDDLLAHHGALDAGVQLIQKPFSSRSLAAKIQEILG